MGRLIKKGEAFEWIEYETGEELVPFYSFEYKGNVSQIYLKENNDNLDVIFNFIDIKENIEYLTEKVVSSFFYEKIKYFQVCRKDCKNLLVHYFLYQSR